MRQSQAGNVLVPRRPHILRLSDRSGGGDRVGAAATALVGGGEGADRSGDLRARDDDVPDRAPTGLRPNQLFPRRRRHAERALSAVGADEQVVPAFEYRASRASKGERNSRFLIARDRAPRAGSRLPFLLPNSRCDAP
jgi:hypothetical protein